MDATKDNLMHVVEECSEPTDGVRGLWGVGSAGESSGGEPTDGDRGLWVEDGDLLGVFCEFGFDVLASSRALGMSPRELVAALLSAENEQEIRRRINVAELHAQWMVSRYRQIAVQQLVQQAGKAEESVSHEQARKAAVDLLRVPGLPLTTTPAADAAHDVHPADAAIERDVLGPLRIAAQQQARDKQPPSAHGDPDAGEVI